MPSRYGFDVGIAVLVSGIGTNLEAIIEADIPVAAVLADRKCHGLEIAEEAGIPPVLVERTDFSKRFDRDAYCDQLLEALGRFEPQLIVSAGFGTVVPKVATTYAGRIINTHPSLLPAFKGWHPVRDALEFGVKVTGCTVHLVTEEMDHGPILAQEPVAILPDDTEESLHERIKAVERRLLPETIKRLLEEI